MDAAMRLLLVEDSELLQRSLTEGLSRSGYAIDVAGNGEDGLHLASTEPYDVVILDIMLPRLNGLTLLKRLREAGNNVHVLLLTARDTVPDRVAGLRGGADDYLVKPFSFDELLARIEALIRRQHTQTNPRLTIGPLTIDFSAKTVTRDGTPLVLPPREFALLEFLALHRGKVVSRSEIESHIYDMHADLMSNAVDSAICALRRKIDRGQPDSMIQTRRGMGYVLETLP